MARIQERFNGRIAWLYDALFVVLSVLIFPTSLIALLYNYGALILCPQYGLRRHVQLSSRFRPRTVVITGVSTPAGLRVARALHATGHHVIGVEIGGPALLNHVRWSKAVSKFYSVPSSERPRHVSDCAENLFRVIVKERASIWIDCADKSWTHMLAPAKKLVEDRTTCICLVPTEDQVRQFGTRHGFHQLAQKLGLPSAESHFVRSRNDIYNVLNGSNGKKYLLSSPNGSTEPMTRTILPRRTVSQTYSDVAQIKLSKSTPWTLDQYVEGVEEFTACAIVIKGKLKAFVASSLPSQIAEYKIVNSKSGLSNAMKQYMENFADAIGSDLSCHLTMQFSLDEKATQAGVVQQLLPRSGSLVAHDSLLLFAGRQGSIDLTKAYMTLLADTLTELQVYTGLPYTESTIDVVAPSGPEIGIYSIYNSFCALVVEPTWSTLILQNSISSLASSWVTFLQHLVAWQETLYAFEDPMPIFWFTHISVPCRLVGKILYDLWSGLRVISKHRTLGQNNTIIQEVRNGQ